MQLDSVDVLFSVQCQFSQIENISEHLVHCIVFTMNSIFIENNKVNQRIELMLISFSFVG